MQQKATIKQLRSFGSVVGAIFAFIGLWPVLIQSKGPRPWALVLAGLLIVPSLVFPRILAPFYWGWMMAGQCLGWFNTRLILGAVFYALFAPVGLVMRLSGRDPMHRRFERASDTYRVIRQPREKSHMKLQF